MSVIPPEEIRYSKLSLVDDVGRVFHWKGGLYRGIYAVAAQQVRDFFSSGCLEELARRELFPRSKITDHALDGFAFVVEHEQVPVVTYPHEWSFEMLRQAALAILEVNEIAVRHGWRLKDCQPYNVLFSNMRPVFVDLGSFIPTTSGVGFAPAAEFLSCYLWPLTIWASGDQFLAQRIISSAHEVMPPTSWRMYQSPLLRLVSPRLRLRAANHWQRGLRGGARLFRKVEWLLEALAPLASRLPGELLSWNTGMMRRKLARLDAPPPTGSWHSYHSSNFQAGELASTPRFDRILDIVRSLGCESVVELAGNQGLFSLLLLMKTSVRRVVCTDYDTHAINRLYECCRNVLTLPSNKSVEPVVLNFMVPDVNFHTSPPTDRFRSDLVIALAITHHLTLTQNFSLREVMRTIANYTNRYAIVEFMPLGLWNGREAPPFPPWYRLEWFQEAFREFFDVLEVEQVETNRVIHVGRLKRPRSA